MSVDTSELDALTKDLLRARRRVHSEARKVMKRGALEVRKGMQRDFMRGANSYAPRVFRSLEFQAIGDDGGLSYRIGELDSAGAQWGLAAILAFGTSNNAPDVDHTAALYAEIPKVEQYLAQAGVDSAFGGAR